ncbi:hypothetical protein [Devosia sp.]|uniref:hypothetical protein n=1 Tax=Devosia sp. TaxID=1871048 RepID=UPI003266F78E
MLDSLMTPQVGGEAIKLAASVGGALLVAKLAVRWALDRYKKEKLWDREVTALTDVLLAIGELRAINSEWLRELETGVHSGEAADAARETRWRIAKAKLDAVASLAAMILPKRAQNDIILLSAALRSEGKEWSTRLKDTDKALTIINDKLLEHGKKHLRGD